MEMSKMSFFVSFPLFQSEDSDLLHNFYILLSLFREAISIHPWRVVYEEWLCSFYF